MTADIRARVIESLRLLPTGTELEWGDDTSGDGEVLADDLLVWVPEVAREAGLNWVWTIASAEPEGGLAPLSIVVPSGAESWTPQHLSRVLHDWVTAHTGRHDITFRYNAELTSDMARQIFKAAADPDEARECVKSPDGRLHSVALETAADGRSMTQCGLLIEPAWTPHSGGLWFPAEMSGEDFDAEWDRACC